MLILRLKALLLLLLLLLLFVVLVINYFTQYTFVAIFDRQVAHIYICAYMCVYAFASMYMHIHVCMCIDAFMFAFVLNSLLPYIQNSNRIHL